jgi:UDP-N-acetylglucosamine 4-epimerase
VPRSLADPIATNDTNITGFLNMLVAARDAKVKSFTYATSSSTYGDHPALPKVEENIGKPLSPYAVTKYVNELYADVFASSYGFNTIGLRYFNVFGHHEGHKGSQGSPVSQFSRQAESGKIKLFHNSDNYLRDFIAVEDVCKTHVEFIKQVKESGVWNIGTGKPVSFEQIARNIAEQYGAKIDYIPMPAKLKDSYQTYTCADMSKTLASLQNKGE